MKPKELMKLLAKDSWMIVRVQGSHHIHKIQLNPEPYQ